MSYDENLIADLISEIGTTLGIKGDPPPNLETAQVAQVLDVTTGTLDVWASTGRHNLPYFKTGRKRRYRTVAVAEFIARSMRHREAG